MIIVFVQNITNDMSNLNMTLTEKNQKKNMEKQFYNILLDFSDAKE